MKKLENRLQGRHLPLKNDAPTIIHRKENAGGVVISRGRRCFDFYYKCILRTEGSIWYMLSKIMVLQLSSVNSVDEIMVI